MAIEATLQSAVQFYEQGAFGRAEKLLQGVTKWAPKDARAWKLLGSLKMLTDRRREAQQYFEQALSLDPNDPYVLVALGELKIDVQRIQEGVELIKKLLAQHESDDHPAANRARQLLQHTYDRLKAVT